MTRKNSIQKQAISAHKKLGGKISVVGKARIKSTKDLNLYYTPGVGAVASHLAANKSDIKKMTIKKNSVAVVSDGSAVLGLGNIGPEGAIPVMEGKAMLFKEFADIDAFPIVLNTQEVEEIVNTVKNIAPIFGGINLEDISAPRCFEVEKKLQEILDIPVMHDDQHGTAIVVFAGLMNALKVAKRSLEQSKITIIGAGAAGHALAELLVLSGAKNIIILDSKGIISRKRTDLDPYKYHLAEITNQQNLSGSLDQALYKADVVIGVSKGDILKPVYLQMMAEKPIVFALANPVPEIMPDQAKKAGAFIVATGRSDFPNQINNVLGFPGIFRGALDHEVKKITPEMKIRAAKKLASLVKNLNPNNIIPSLFDKKVVKAVASAIR